MLGIPKAAVCAVALLTLPVSTFAQNTQNPINGSAAVAPWSLVLEDVFRLPNNSVGTARPELIVGNPVTGLNYVIDQYGPVYSFDPSAANPTATVFLFPDVVPGNVHKEGESGVRSLAFHPDFGNVGMPGFRKMYTTISRTSSAQVVGNPVVFDSPGSLNHWTTIGEWTLNASGSVDFDSYRELMRIEQPFGNHNSGHLGFNPAVSLVDPDYGKLYISVGDGGDSGGPFDLSQDIDATPAPYPHGKILRIDPIASGNDPYSVPSDNPFFGQANRIQELWAYGLRNPHKFSFDPVTGEMYISDIGQGTVEEINIGRPEANYGWNDREGSFVYVNGNTVSPLPANHPSDAYTYPVAQYDHNGTNGTTPAGTAIVGGSVYRGDDVPELTGMYLFADFSNNPSPIFAVDVDDLVERDNFTNVTSLDGGRLAPFVEVEIRDDGVDKDFRQFLNDTNGASFTRTGLRWGVGIDGEIYITSKSDSWVRRIVGVVDLAPGDANRDGNVDGEDLERWAAGFGLAGDWSDGNFNAGLVTDGEDFLLWQRNVSVVLSAQSVPESSTIALLAAAILAQITSRRRFAQG